jgi:large subunit ribosomal protein L16
MPLMPARVKYRKMHRGNRAGLAYARQHGGVWRVRIDGAGALLAGHQADRGGARGDARNMKRTEKMWIRIFPQKSFTKKPLETRMGKGKGPLESWVAVIRPANVLFEVDGVTEAVARESLRLAATKLPIRTKFISRHRGSR